jgi:hypothetical protein
MVSQEQKLIIVLASVLALSIVGFFGIDSLQKQQLRDNTIHLDSLVTPTVTFPEDNAVVVALYYNLSDPSKPYILEEGIFKEVEIIT